MSTLVKKLVLISALILATLPAVGQTAKQGEPPTDLTVFHSPMVLETTFAPADPTLWVSDNWTPEHPKPWKGGEFTIPEYHALGKYTCDGLALRNHYSLTKGTWKSGIVMTVTPIADAKVKITINTRVTNPGNVHDKMATFVFEIMNGEELVGRAQVRFKAKQNWHRNPEDSEEETKLILPADALKKNPVTTMRITMTTEDY